MNVSLWSAFLTGLLTGGLSCLAVQGGLLASSIGDARAVEGENSKHRSALPIAVFLAAKLVGYGILGLLLGWLGEKAGLSLSVRALLQIAAAVFMIGTALNFLEVHPFFRRFVLRAPRSLERLAKKSTRLRFASARQARLSENFAPAVLGLATIFLPCGVTQAMMVSAIASGNPVSAAGIMFFFVLGTVPLFFVLGYTATKLGETMHRRFMKVAGILIMALGLHSLYTGAALAGFELPSIGGNGSVAVENLPPGIRSESLSGQSTTAQATVTDIPNAEPTIHIGSSGYSPSQITLPANTKVKIKLVNEGGYSCAQGFTVPKYGIQKIVSPGTSDFVEFTTPASGEHVPFMCVMGMYRGEFLIQ